jgi:hypothetical protein
MSNVFIQQHTLVPRDGFAPNRNLHEVKEDSLKAESMRRKEICMKRYIYKRAFHKAHHYSKRVFPPRQFQFKVRLRLKRGVFVVVFFLFFSEKLDFCCNKCMARKKSADTQKKRNFDRRNMHF